MKVFIALLLVFASLSDGRLSDTTLSTSTISTASTTTTTSPTVSTTTTAPTTVSTTTTVPTTSTTTELNTTSSSTGSTTTTVTTTLASTSTTTTPSPTAQVSINVTWTFASETSVTNVIMTVKNLKSGQYAALGLGQNQTMGEAHVFICKQHSDDKVSVERYINPQRHQPSESAGSEQGGVFTPLPPKSVDGVITCQFNMSNFTTTRVKRLNSLRPLTQSGNYYPLFAVGELDEDSEPQKHDSREAQTNFVQLNKKTVISFRVPPGPAPGSSLRYIKAHGIIMVLTWMFLVSTGVLISRYFKTTWAKKLLCGKDAWYAAHRFLMSLAAVLTTLAFLFILVALEGTWVDSEDEKRHYIHSITGALVISLAFFQPFVALFRCDPNTPYRFIFNYLHAFFGFAALLLSIVTLFLATYFALFKDDKARTIMIVWTIWIIFIFIIFESVQHYFKMHRDDSNYSKINSSSSTIGELTESPTSPSYTTSRNTNEPQSSSEIKIKNVLFAVHVLIAAILSIYFSTLIA